MKHFTSILKQYYAVKSIFLNKTMEELLMLSNLENNYALISPEKEINDFIEKNRNTIKIL